MKKKTIAEQIEIVCQFEVRGVPDYQLKRMCRMAGISYPKLCKELGGQTGCLVGNIPLTYASDIINFIKGWPVLD